MLRVRLPHIVPNDYTGERVKSDSRFIQGRGRSAARLNLIIGYPG